MLAGTDKDYLGGIIDLTFPEVSFEFYRGEMSLWISDEYECSLRAVDKKVWFLGIFHDI